MVTDTTTDRAAVYLALADRVEAGGTGDDTDAEVLRALGATLTTLYEDESNPFGGYSAWAWPPATTTGSWREINGRLTTSLDAIASLQEAVLPGWRVDSILERLDDVRELRSTNGWTVDLVRPFNSRRAAGFAATLRQAWLAALLRALAMEAGRG